MAGKNIFLSISVSRWVLYPVILLFAALFFVWHLSNLLIKPFRETSGPGPEIYSIPYAKTILSTDDGERLNAWFVKGLNGKAVILCHGIGAEKSQMLNYAVFLYRAGYSVLMFDFRGHGENKEAFTSIGYIEVKDLEAAAGYVKKLGYKKFGVLGISMGASVALRAAAKDPDIAAVIADSPFASLNGMIRYRAEQLRLPYWPAVPAVKILAKFRTGFNFDEVNPARDVKYIKSPVFIIHGLADKNIPPENGKEIFAAANEPKELFLVPFAGHVESHVTAPKEYERRVLAFFGKYL